MLKNTIGAGNNANNGNFIHSSGSVTTFRSDNSSMSTTTSSTGSSSFGSGVALRSSRRHSLKPSTIDYSTSSPSDPFFNPSQYSSDPFSSSNLKAHLEHVDMAGYLNVRRKQLISKNWKRRWFMLKDQQLICYLNGPQSEICGIFSLLNYYKISHEPECRQSTLCMVLYSDQIDIEPLYLFANTPVEYQSWFFSIDKCLREKSVNIIDRVMERLNTKHTDFYHERNSMSIETHQTNPNRYSHDFRLDPAPHGKKSRQHRSGSISAWSNSQSTIFNNLSLLTTRMSNQFSPSERDEFDLDNESICSRVSLKQKFANLPAKLVPSKFQFK